MSNATAQGADVPEAVARETVVRDSVARGASAREPLAPGLYLVATPIGNLEDITLRALRVLRTADRIACEDTRQTQKLLNHFGIERPTVSYHLHNEDERAQQLVEALKAGSRIAVVSDAGTPGIADPGGLLVRAAVAAGVPVFPIPGANAAVMALVASGLSPERFDFHGFLPAKEGRRRTRLEEIRTALEGGDGEGAPTQVFYEAPHRIVEALQDVVAVFGEMHPVALARELTKLHEEFLRGTAAEVLTELKARTSVRGEMVLLLAGKVSRQELVSTGNVSPSLGAAVRDLIQREAMSEKDALKRVARDRGLGKSEAYREWQRSRERLER